MPIRWTEAEISTAAQLWRDGFSASQIGAQVGRPRSSVCGLANRKREQFPSKPYPKYITRPGRPKAENKPKTLRKSALVLDFRLPPIAVVKVQKPIREPVAPTPTAPDCKPVAFLDIADTCCKFPLWNNDSTPGPDSPCCGARIDFGAVYCGFHQHITARHYNAKENASVAKSLTL